MKLPNPLDKIVCELLKIYKTLTFVRGMNVFAIDFQNIVENKSWPEVIVT